MEAPTHLHRKQVNGGNLRHTKGTGNALLLSQQGGSGSEPGIKLYWETREATGAAAMARGEVSFGILGQRK